MELCVDVTNLRAALAEIERAEANGFDYCLAVFQIAHVGPMLHDCLARYSDLIERAHPRNGSLNWGRFQDITRRNIFDGKKLVPLVE